MSLSFISIVCLLSRSFYHTLRTLNNKETSNYPFCRPILIFASFAAGGIRFSAEKPRRLRYATGISPSAAFRIPLQIKGLPRRWRRSPFWRSGRDSNPRAIARKLISSQPRYDHFDTAAYSVITLFSSGFCPSAPLCPVAASAPSARFRACRSPCCCHSFLLAASAAGGARKRPHFDTAAYSVLAPQAALANVPTLIRCTVFIHRGRYTRSVLRYHTTPNAVLQGIFFSFA